MKSINHRWPLALLVCAFLLFNTFLIASGSVGKTIKVYTRGLNNRELRDVHISYLDDNNVSCPFRRYGSIFSTYALVKNITLYVYEEQAAKLKQVQVKIGSERYVFKKADLKCSYFRKKKSFYTYEIDTTQIHQRSIFKKWNGLMNYIGDLEFFTNLFYSFIKFILIMVCLWWIVKWMGNEKIRRLILVKEEEGFIVDNAGDKYGLFGGFFFLLLALTILEVIQPYYFTKDDNYAQFMPVILQACRSLFDHGIFSTMNPHQMIGSPTVDVGTYALTYPITYLCYLVSRFTLGNENLFMEVFGVLHLTVGYFLMYYFLKIHKIRPIVCATACLSFILSGFNLVIGRSWYYMLPSVVWFPWLFIMLKRLQSVQSKWRWTLSTGIIIGMYFHSGNVQMWIYGLMFFGITSILMVTRGMISKEKVAWIISASLIGLGLATPLLLVQMHVTKNIFRYSYGNGIFEGFSSMFIPYPLAAPHPNFFLGKNLFEFFGQLYYSGTLYITVAFVAIFWCFFNANRSSFKTIIDNNIWLFVGVIAFLFSLGNHGGLWIVMSLLPLFDKFTNPFKFMLFSNFLLIVAGALLVERLYRNRTIGIRLLNLIVIMVLPLILYHTILSRASFFDYGQKPYPKMTGIVNTLRDSKDQYRIYSIAPWRSSQKNYALALEQNFATVYGFYSIYGYEPLVKSISIPNNEKLQKYGVRWIIIYHKRDPSFPVQYDLNLYRTITKKVIRNKEFYLVELKNPDPLAFETKTKRPVEIEFRGDGANIVTDTMPQGGEITVNMLNRSGMKASAQEKQLKLISDKYKRIVVKFPKGTKQVKIRYEPDLLKGLFLGLVLILAGILILPLLALLNKENSGLTRS